ncbi:MAG: pyridoxal-5'-phosphate-dependent protein [Caulobacterales bacterium 32-69-10]|nr:MAG: pyridoxal-5'-phosphate-dependent protein [Caulobacterales bacterium 32-69-10]
MGPLPTFDDILDAAERLATVAVRTPLLRSDALDAAAGGRVFVKAEALQRTGSFKIRGAYNRLCRLSKDELKTGVVAFSSGNHAQGVAEAARLLGCPAVIVMPADAPTVKMEATRAMGAEVVLYDRLTESREAISAAIAAERGAVVVPSFDDFHVIAGQGTVGLEAARQLEAIGESADVLLCPVSGGGLIAGISLAFERLSPKTQIHSVEPEGFDDHARSLAAGERLSNPPGANSISDALLAPMPGELTFAINRRRLASGLTASDDAALNALAFGFRHLKLVLEPGGALGLAALLSGRLDLGGRCVVVIASGGNVDAPLFSRALLGGAGV